MNQPDLAYLILCHEDFYQVQRLIDRLRCGNEAVFFVHIDARVSHSRLAKQLAAQFAEEPIVHFLSTRRVRWGGFSLVDATLDLLRCSASLPTIRYFRLLSGSDFPLRSASEIASFHRQQDGTNFIVGQPAELALPSRGAWDRVRYYYWPEWIECNFSGRLYRMVRDGQKQMGIRRKLPAGLIRLWIGGQWWSLHRSFVDWLLDFLHERSDVLRYFRRTALSDEIFFQTLLRNSPFSSTHCSDSLLYEQWPPNAGHPKVLRVSDLPNLVSSGKLFARKFKAESEALVQQLLRIESSKLGYGEGEASLANR